MIEMTETPRYKPKQPPKSASSFGSCKERKSFIDKIRQKQKLHMQDVSGAFDLSQIGYAYFRLLSHVLN